jgi:hypothetical protein
VEGSGSCLIEVLSRDLYGGTEEDHEKHQYRVAGLRIEI